MTVTDKEYNKYHKIAMVVTQGNKYYADEITQGLFLKLLELKKNLDDLNYSYILNALKNRYLKLLEKESYKNKFINLKLDENKNNELDEVEYNIEVDEENKIKEQAIENIMLQMDYFNKQLYILHFIKGYSQRRISRESGITLKVILAKVKKIKEKINNEYERLKNEKNK